MKYLITEKDDGHTIERFLRNRKYSSRTLSKLKSSGGIRLNGEIAFVIKKIKTGDMLEVNFIENCDIVPSDIPINIMYEDEHVMILNKPSGICVHPTAYHYDDTIANGVVKYFLDKGLKYGIHPVNRLDRDTSGVFILALNRHAHDFIQAHGKVEKIYTAIVSGAMEGTGTIDEPIGRKPGSFIERYVTPDGQRAVTYYEVIKNFGDMTLLKVVLETGRTHQIRVHLSYIGHPIVGDTLYGCESPLICRQALHCSTMSFIHPITYDKMTFTADMPEDMKKVIKRKM